MAPIESSSSDPDLLRNENVRLRRAVEELSVLNDLAKTIGASLDSQQIMDTIVRRSIRAVDAEQGVITLVDQQSPDPLKTFVRVMDGTSTHERLRPTEHFLGWMHLNRKPLVVNDAKNDERFRGVQWDETVHSVLCVPMMVRSELQGVLTVYNKKKGTGFTEDDQRLLAILASQSAQVIENARLNEREKQLLKMQEEIRLASKIQMELLPKEAPSVPGYQIAGRTIPAQIVGGDYFDFIHIGDDRFVFCVGDVSGKGLPASLLMANTQATIRGQSIHLLTPSECMSRSNHLLFQSTEAEKFVTLFYAMLDFRDHTIRYSNAGHEHPVLLGTTGEPRRLDVGGVPLGMLEDFSYREDVVGCRPGDLLVVCSDGICEAMNAQQEQFGGARLDAVIRESRDSPAGVLVEKILGAVHSYVGAAPRTDDMTVIVVKRE